MTTTPIHGWDTWPAGITQANQIVNDFLASIDTKLAIRALSMTTDNQPGSPAEGDAYIMTASPVGAAWSSYSQYDVAVYIAGAWTAFPPTGAITAYVVDQTKWVGWNGSSYTDLLQSVSQYPGQREVTGTSDTLALTDAGKMIWTSNAAAVTVSIPDNSSVAFEVDTRIDLCQFGDGVLTVDCPGTDVLYGNGQAQAKYRGLSLWKKDATSWIVFGGTTP
jgi:hypothetical protein